MDDLGAGLGGGEGDGGILPVLTRRLLDQAILREWGEIVGGHGNEATARPVCMSSDSVMNLGRYT